MTIKPIKFYMYIREIKTKKKYYVARQLQMIRSIVLKFDYQNCLFSFNTTVFFIFFNHKKVY